MIYFNYLEFKHIKCKIHKILDIWIISFKDIGFQCTVSAMPSTNLVSPIQFSIFPVFFPVSFCFTTMMDGVAYYLTFYILIR